MSGAPQIRVLLVEDSPSQRATLAWVIGAAPELVLVGEAANGEQALEMVHRLSPDIVLMDCHMPVMDGITATRQIMRECPAPILITSASFDAKDVHPGLEALREGALAIVPKPSDPQAPDFDALAAELCLSLRLMADVKVVRRVPPRTSRPWPTTGITSGMAKASTPSPLVVAIGASTGGPPVVLEILRGLAEGLDVPVLIVQHMALGFIAGFASWLARGSGLPVEIASADVIAQSGHVYVAPEDRHLGIDHRRRLTLADGPAENGFRPSISHLFRSVGNTCGSTALAVLLTGMGDDGAEGLADVARCGGVTVVQDRETSVVFGMPGAALQLGAAQHVLPPADISRFILAQLARKSLPS